MNIIRNKNIDISLLRRLMQKPQIYHRSPNYIWTDDHVGRQMLSEHLNPDIDSASLKHATIDKQTEWITQRIGYPDQTSILDIGCGPGLFCERFADAGFQVTGLDFNRHSLSHAKTRASMSDRSIDYIFGDYVELDLGRSFDAITLINRDFSALTPDERDRLLSRVNRHLKRGGTFILDMMSATYFPKLVERNQFQLVEGGGFWAPGYHMVLEQTVLYEEEMVQLEKYAVIEQDGYGQKFPQLVDLLRRA